MNPFVREVGKFLVNVKVNNQKKKRDNLYILIRIFNFSHFIFDIYSFQVLIVRRLNKKTGGIK